MSIPYTHMTRHGAVIERCGFCMRLGRIYNRLGQGLITRKEMDAEVEALFDLADRTARLHEAYGRRRRRP